MDKKIVLLIILFLVGGRTFSQVHYSIEGSTDHEYEGRKVALVMLEEDNRQADSTNVVNGKFIFKGELLQPCWAAVCIDGVDGIFTVLENGNIRICTDGKEGWCEGTPINDVFQKSWREYQVLNRAARDDFKKLDSLSVATADIENAVSVPNGSQGMTWVPYCFDWVSRFEKIVVFGDFEKGHMTLLEDIQKRFPNKIMHVREQDYR